MPTKQKENISTQEKEENITLFNPQLYSIKLNSPSGTFSEIAQIINDCGGHIGDIKVVESNQTFVKREVHFTATTIQAREIISKLHDLPGTHILDVQNEVYNTHIGHRGYVYQVNHVALK